MIRDKQYEEWPVPAQTVTVRSHKLFAGLLSKVKRRVDVSRLEITTPYDVNGDPFYIPIGEAVILEWDKQAEAYQKEFIIEDYREVIDFLRDERKLPTVILGSQARETDRKKIKREFYRTDLNLPIEIQVENKVFKVEISDISGGGLSFLYERPIGIKRRIDLHMPILGPKNNLFTVHLGGHSVNLHMVHPRLYRMGVQFDHMPEAERDKLIRFVNGCTGKKRSGMCKTCKMKDIGCMVQ